ncbi:MAG TPA: hypothetical protein VGE40_06700 [Bacilli bacterium]
MDSNVFIPDGDDKITIELTVKEAIALTGVRFNGDPNAVLDARKKLKHTLDDKLKVEAPGLH